MDNATKMDLFKRAWKEVLGVAEVGDNDNFFEAGGDSVKGVQLVGWLTQKGLKLDMLKIYTEPTVSQLVESLEETQPMAVPAEMLTKDNMATFMQDPTAQKIAQQAMANGAMPVQGQAPQAGAQQQLCTPQQGAPQQLCTPQQGAPQQLCTPQQGAPQQLCTPQQGAPQQGAPQQLCTPQQGALQQLCTPQQGAPQQLCTPQQGAPQQLCTPEQMFAPQQMMAMPQMMTMPQMMLVPQMMAMPQMMTMPQMMLVPQMMAMPMLMTMPQMMAPMQMMPPVPQAGGQQQLCTPAQGGQQQLCTPNEAKNTQTGGSQPYMAVPVNAPIENPTTMKINEPHLGPVTKSPEDALDTVLSSIFTNGYDKQVNLFEQGLDSFKMMQIVTRCGEQGYRVQMQDIMKDPTFKGILAGMKTE